MRIRLPGALIVIVLLLAACTAEDGARPEPEPAPPATQSPEPSPPPEPLACEGADFTPQEGRLTGDVDGDGTDDEVFVAVDPEAEPGCRAVVEVETAGGTLRAPAAAEGGGTGSLGPPVLNTLADLDGDGDLEIAVDLLAGASTVFLGVYTAVDGGLARVAAVDGPARGDLFGYGGSVGHIDGIDCASEQTLAEGLVVVSSALPKGRVYVARRSFYELVGAELSVRPELSERHRLEPEDLGQFSEFGSAPFGSCPTD